MVQRKEALPWQVPPERDMVLRKEALPWYVPQDEDTMQRKKRLSPVGMSKIAQHTI